MESTNNRKSVKVIERKGKRKRALELENAKWVKRRKRRRERKSERENKGPDVKTNYTKVQGAGAKLNAQSPVWRVADCGLERW